MGFTWGFGGSRLLALAFGSRVLCLGFLMTNLRMLCTDSGFGGSIRFCN